jgi:hypothetical protein
MDYVTRQILDTAHKLQRTLSNLVDAIRDSNKSSHRQSETSQRNIIVRLDGELTTKLKAEEAAEHHKHSQHNNDFWPQWITAIATTLAFIAAVRYAGIANSQLTEMKRSRMQTREAIAQSAEANKIAADSLEITRDNFRSDQRPYVFLNLSLDNRKPGEPMSAFSVGQYLQTIKGRIVWSFHFKNFGKSPAFDVKIDRHLALGPNAWQKVKWRVPEHNNVILPPGQDDYTSAMSDEVPVDQIEYLFSADNGVAVFGHIDYQGPDGKSYWSEFCWFRLRNGVLVNCPTHNIIQ